MLIREYAEIQSDDPCDSEHDCYQSDHCDVYPVITEYLAVLNKEQNEYRKCPEQRMISNCCGKIHADRRYDRPGISASGARYAEQLSPQTPDPGDTAYADFNGIERCNKVFLQPA